MSPTRALRGRRRILVVLAAVVAVLGLVTYLLWPRKPDHVLIVGDSVSYMSMPAIAHDLGEDTAAEALTLPGYTSSDLLPLATKAVDDREKAGHPLDRAIFLVGYNDVMRDRVATADLPRLVEQSARYECAIWLTLPGRPGGAPARTESFTPTKVDAWNERVRELVARHDNLHLVTAWERAADDSARDELVGPDGVHPTEAGSEKLAEVMVDRLLSECRFA